MIQQKLFALNTGRCCGDRKYNVHVKVAQTSNERTIIQIEVRQVKVWTPTNCLCVTIFDGRRPITIIVRILENQRGEVQGFVIASIVFSVHLNIEKAQLMVDGEVDSMLMVSVEAVAQSDFMVTIGSILQ